MNEQLTDSGWQALMAAPWGDFSPEAKAAKDAAHAAYVASCKRFWTALPSRAAHAPEGGYMEKRA